MPLPRLLRLTLSLGLVAALLGAGPLVTTARAVDLDSAWQDLEQLKKSVKSSKSTNEDLLQYLDAVMNAFKKPDEPAKPADDASEEEKKAFEKTLADFEKDREKFRAEAEKVVLKLMTLVKAQNNENIRNDVNIRAGNALGEMAEFLDDKGRKELTKKIIKAIESKLIKVKTHDVSAEVLEAVFAAVGKQNQEEGLQWMLKEWTNANEVQKAYLIAAHKAMVLFTFENVDGKFRQEICDEFVKVYSSVESQAEQSSTDPKILAKKRFWDDIKTYTIPVVQYFAGKPTNADGVALSTMAEFQEFMREHKSLRRPPWVDEKVDDSK